MSTIAEIATWKSENATVVDWVNRNGSVNSFDDSFPNSLARQLHRKGMLSERQAAAVLQSIERDAEWDRKRAEENKNAAPAPSGTVTVEGEVITCKEVDSPYGIQKKMIVRTDAGWKVWCTVPNALRYALNLDRTGDTFLHALLNKRVRFTATLTVSDRDEHFAFGKRPRNAEVVSS